MATFVWDPAMQWPPPREILLYWDVILPSEAPQSTTGPAVMHGKDFSSLHTYGGYRIVTVTPPQSFDAATPSTQPSKST